MFVLAAVGTRHVALAATALRFLKMFSRSDIVVVQSRSQMRAPHDQVLEVELPADLDDHQASIALKTDLLRHVRGLADRFCYLDTDVIAVNDGVDSIFDQPPRPVAFCADHAQIDTFSPWALTCGCPDPGCGHLREALREDFGIDVPQGDWQMWNGGVFTFDEDAEAFLGTWHAMARRIMELPRWRTRDQGVLAGTAWKLGLQDHPPLPAGFNQIVDCMRNVDLDRRPAAGVADLEVDERYCLGPQAAPHFLHFINDGMWRRGWRNWDEVERLLRRGTEPMGPPEGSLDTSRGAAGRAGPAVSWPKVAGMPARPAEEKEKRWGWNKAHIINFWGGRRRCRTYLEVCSLTTGGRYGEVDRSKYPTCHRLMYRCPEDFDDGLGVDFRSGDLDIGGCVAQINARGLRYDVVLVDSLHFYDPSLRDLKVASELIEDGGTIIVHDCNPPTEDVAGPGFMTTPWAGVSYKAYVDFVLSRDDLAYFTVDTDWGCGVIRKRRSRTRKRTRASESVIERWLALGEDYHAAFHFLQDHKDALLNLISVHEFFRNEAHRR